MVRISYLLVCILLLSFPALSGEAFWHQTGAPLSTQDVRSIAANSQGSIFSGTWTAGEVYKSTNNGDTWTVCGAIPNTNPVLGLAIDQQDYIFASVFLRGVARSTDNGASWQMMNSGLTNNAVRGILVDKHNAVWVATEGGLFRSSNGGENWTNTNPKVVSGVFQDSSGTILIQSSDELGNAVVYSSIDSGKTWSHFGLTGFGLMGIHADGSYFGSTADLHFVYRSTDQGASWVKFTTPVTWGDYTMCAMFPSNGDIFFARDGNSAGVIRSTDMGQTWEIKNDGLTTTRVIPLFYDPKSTYLFLGTNGGGVFRSSQPTAPQAISLSLPTSIAAAGGSLEIPVTVSNLSGWGICAYQFVLNFNSPDSIIGFDATPITRGTLSGANGWSVLINTSEPNKITIGAYGSTPLAGQGELLRLKLTVSQQASAGDTTSLSITQLVLNNGTPTATVHDGNLVIHQRVCGDADESGQVQAYDAALALREALGPMNPPPAPLTAIGRLNADVTQDGKVQAYDAVLILRHAIGLALPESTMTCFGGQAPEGSPVSLALTGKLIGVEHGTNHTAVVVQLANVPSGMQVYSYSFNLACTPIYGDSITLTLPTLSQDYLATVNSLGDGHFRVGIINPYGVDVKAIPLTLSAQNASSLNQVTFEEIYLNDVPNAVISMTSIVNSIEPPPVPAMPQSYDLLGAYPNPFNPSTQIVVQTPEAAQVHLEIYTAQGARIRVLTNGLMSSGQHVVAWDGTNASGQPVATGQYFCVMRAGSFVKTMRLMLLK
jgi:hypothetical protein